MQHQTEINEIREYLGTSRFLFMNILDFTITTNIFLYQMIINLLKKYQTAKTIKELYDLHQTFCENEYNILFTKYDDLSLLRVKIIIVIIGKLCCLLFSNPHRIVNYRNFNFLVSHNKEIYPFFKDVIIPKKYFTEMQYTEISNDQIILIFKIKKIEFSNNTLDFIFKYINLMYGSIDEDKKVEYGCRGNVKNFLCSWVNFISQYIPESDVPYKFKFITDTILSNDMIQIYRQERMIEIRGILEMLVSRDIIDNILLDYI